MNYLELYKKDKYRIHKKNEEKLAMTESKIRKMHS